MLKKTITYETFDGEEVREDFYFHLSKADLVELQMSKKGGLEEWVKRVVASKDGKAIMEEFKNLILMSVGEKSDDGKRFRKTLEHRADFKDSPAYDVLFMELVTDAAKASEFINGLLPANLEREMAKVPKPARSINEAVEAEKIKEGLGSANVFEQGGDPTGLSEATSEVRLVTEAEIREMPEHELREGLAKGTLRVKY